MKIFNRYGIHLPSSYWKKWRELNPKADKFKLLDKLICITKHGTICRKGLEAEAERRNAEGKNLDYSDGLTLGKQYYVPKKAKTALRKKELAKLKDVIDKKEATDEEKRLYKKWKLLTGKGY